MTASIAVEKLVQLPATICPFCSQENLMIRSVSIGIVVTCLTCQANGPIKSTQEEALDAWNQAGLIQEKAIAVAKILAVEAFIAESLAKPIVPGPI